jgi:hypothetical protein
MADIYTEIDALRADIQTVHPLGKTSHEFESFNEKISPFQKSDKKFFSPPF